MADMTTVIWLIYQLITRGPHFVDAALLPTEHLSAFNFGLDLPDKSCDYDVSFSVARLVRQRVSTR